MGYFDFLKRTAAMPPIHFHNTLSGAEEAFVPLSSRVVKMYNCGPTVYDHVHIGNLRPYIFADTVRRVLDQWHYRVKQVINITDVGHLVADADDGEDKMEVSARNAGTSAQDIAHAVTEDFFNTLDLLGIDRKKIQFPRATQYIGEQISLIQALKEKGYAYHTSDGVYFDTAKFTTYGKLGNIDLAGLETGVRVEQNPEKKNPHDFALWKLTKGGEKRQQEWESPWGKGFPGWHIECTAMIFTLLGKQIDIHTGGIDHIPTHHNNEIAQAESLTGKQYSRYWMHNAFITIEGKKISKSIGNTVYLHNIIDRGFSPRALRYWYLTGHYRSPMNFTWEAIEGANTALARLTRFFFEDSANAPKGEPDEAFMAEFRARIAHDLDTPGAIALIWDLIKDTRVSLAVKHASLLEADTMLGLGLAENRIGTRLDVVPESSLPQEVQQLVKERELARRDKDFKKADELREKIVQAGFEVKDRAEGSELNKK